MRHSVIAVAVISALLGSTAQNSRGDIAYSVGEFMNFEAFSGVYRLNTDTGKSEMLIQTPGVFWFGATDGPTPDTFFAVAMSGVANTSELFLINTTSLTYAPPVNVTTPVPSTPIRELALDESTATATSAGTLYGTDGENLFAIPLAGGPACFVNTFRKDSSSGAAIGHVYSLDYDPIAETLVGTSWRPDPTGIHTGYSDLYRFDRSTGVGTLINGDTGMHHLTDVWYSHDSLTLFGVDRFPMQVFEFYNGVADNKQPTDASFYGLANATPGPGAVSSPPYMVAPLADGGYQIYTPDPDVDVDVLELEPGPELGHAVDALTEALENHDIPTATAILATAWAVVFETPERSHDGAAIDV